MALFLEITQGSPLGERVLLTAGLRIGRSEGDFQIQDAKISSLHARVEEGEKGQYFLVDAGSTNGLRVGGQKVAKVAMLPGVILQMGKTTLKVVELFKNEVIEPSFTPTNWREVITREVRKGQFQNQTQAVRAAVFAKSVQLNIRSGIQLGTEWVLGFGPRDFGSRTLDFELLEDTSPAIAFSLSPDGDKVRFDTRYPDLVLLNDLPLNSDTLKEGDKIRIGQTLIEFSFVKASK